MDEEDEMLIRAMEESLKHYQEVELPIRQLLDGNSEDGSAHFDEPVPITLGNPVRNVQPRHSLPTPLAPTPAKPPSTSKNSPGPSTSRNSLPPPIAPIFKMPAPKQQPVASTSHENPGTSTSRNSWQAEPSTSRNTEQHEQQQQANKEPLQLFSKEKTLTDEGFCMFTGRHWVYPTNYPERKYQLDMVQTALFHNTLVCLPTGLGKTFIAAVVMYNFYRWFPKGKIIFMAPTKPLVAQQIKACYEITGIPKEDTEELTGSTNADRRTTSWRQKRVFFATPQVVYNDLLTLVCPAETVRCLVVDEAHRAQGNYAYCQVVNTLRAYSQNFRVLALSATPGSDINSVKQVLGNLFISKLKIATEDSPDVAQYTHHREVETIKVSPTPELNEARERFLSLMDKYWRPLVQNSIINGFNTAIITQFQVKTSMDKMLKKPPTWLSPAEVSRLQTNCLICITLCHAQELLQNYGLRSFLSYIQGVLSDSKSNKFVVGILSKDEDLSALIDSLNEKLGLRPGKKLILSTAQNGEMVTSKIIYGHPKLQKLQEIVVQHFLEYEDQEEKTRAIIFCQYRDSVEEIKNVLKQLEPIVKPMVFIGQAKSKGSGGLTQKQQLQVMRDFRNGDFNTLISTCVGEEGLDIGEVDLIVCVDASRSPIRLVQRMGRTGRKRSGRIVMLLSEGREYKKYIDGKNQQSRISKAILTSGKLVPILNQMTSPRMIPRGLTPEIYRTVLNIPKEMKDQDIRTMARNMPAVEPENPFSSAEELAEWDGEVPSFKYMKFKHPQLSFMSLGEIQDLLEDATDEDDSSVEPRMQLNNWLEWQRSLQGRDSAFHSSDSNLLVEVLQLGDRMNLDNPALLTQTTELVSQVNHSALWNNEKGKGRGRGARSRPSKEAAPGPQRGGIAWCLQQQGIKTKTAGRPLTPDFINLEEADVFNLPHDVHQKIPEKSEVSEVITETLEAIKKLSLHISLPEVPAVNAFTKVLSSVAVFTSAISKANSKPDLTLSPPDDTVLDSIFADLKLNNQDLKLPGEKLPDDTNVTEELSPDTMQQIIDLEQQENNLLSPILGKRKFIKSQENIPSIVQSQKVKHFDMETTALDKTMSPQIIDEPNSPINKTASPEPLVNHNKSVPLQPLTSHHKPGESQASNSHKKPNATRVLTSQQQPNVPKASTSHQKSVVPQPLTSNVKSVPSRNNNVADVSQGMHDFLMNFDLGFDDDEEDLTEITTAKPETKIQAIQTSPVNLSQKPSSASSPLKNASSSSVILNRITTIGESDSFTSNSEDKKSEIQITKTARETKPCLSNTDIGAKKTAPQAGIECHMNFNLLDDDDEDNLFGDMDIYSWMGEYEKLQNKSQQNIVETRQKDSPKVVPETPQSSSSDVRKESPAVTRSKSPDLFSDETTESPSPRKRVSNKEINPTLKLLDTNSLKKTSPVLLEHKKVTTTSPLLFTGSSESGTFSSSEKSVFNKEPVPQTKQKENIEKTSDIVPINSTDDTLRPIKISKLSIKNKQLIKPTTVPAREEKVTKSAEVPAKKQSFIESPILRRIQEEDQNKSTSSNESVIQVRRSKGKVEAIIVSSDEDKSLGTQEHPIDINSDESDDQVTPRPAGRAKHKDILSSSDDHSVSSDDHFVQPGAIHRKRKSIEEYEQRPKKSKMNEHANNGKRNKKKRSANEFLDVEAEVSGEVESADEMEYSQMDQYDESFINNFTQADPSIDMRAQYLRSVKSPVFRGKFKIPDLQAKNVYKSPGAELDDDDDDDTYMNDSFCVESVAGDTGQSSAEELDELEAKLEAKRQLKKRERNDVASPNRAGNTKGKRLKRIVIHSSSSDEETAAASTSVKDQISQPHPVATSTPHASSKIKGFEGDYVDDDELDAFLLNWTITQEAEMIKQAAEQSPTREKKPLSRTLFAEQDDAEIKPLNFKVYPENKPASSLRRSEDQPGPSWRNANAPINRQPNPMSLTKNQENQSKSNLNNMNAGTSKLSMIKSKPITSVIINQPTEQRSESRFEAGKNPAQSATTSRPTEHKYDEARFAVKKPAPLTSTATTNRHTEQKAESRIEAVINPVQSVTTSRPAEQRFEAVKNPPPNAVIRPRPISVPNQPQASSSATIKPAPTQAGSSSRSSTPVIIASTKQVTCAGNLLTILRVAYKVNVLIKTLPSGIEYVISQRLAIGRQLISDVTSSSATSDIATSIRSLRQNFRFVVLVLENNLARPVSEPLTSWEPQRHQVPGSKQLRMVLCHLRRVGVKVVFTKDQAETAGILHNLAVKETQSKFGIQHSCKDSCDPAFDVRLRFFTTLPGVNVALGLKLVHQFPVISDFISRCTSAGEIERLLGVDRRQATSILQIMSHRLQ